MRKPLSLLLRTDWLRFAAVGAFNTVLGYVVTLAAHYGAGFTPHWANVLGYAVGGTFSYFLNRSFTFRSQRSHRRALPLFVVCWLLCFGMNNLTLSLGLQLGWPFPVAVLAGMVTFTVAFYGLSRWFVFQPQPPSDP